MLTMVLFETALTLTPQVTTMTSTAATVRIATRLPVSVNASPCSSRKPPASATTHIARYVPSTNSSRACSLPRKYW